MSTMKLGEGLVQLGAAAVGAGVLAVPLLQTSALLWLAGVGAAAFAVGLLVLVTST